MVMKCGWINQSLGISVQHHEASFLMPKSGPRDRFFYPHLTFMKNSIESYYFVTKSREESDLDISIGLNHGLWII